MIEVLVQDEWTTKDIMAHITSWERELLRWLDMAAQGLPPDMPLPGAWSDYVDAFNNQVYVECRDYPLVQVLTDWRQTYQKLQVELEALPEDENDPLWSVWLDEKPPWGFIATFPEHYRFHRWLLEAQMANELH